MIVDVDVEEQPTGSFTLGGSYSVDDGIGVAIGISENNFLGRGQQLSFNISTAQDTEAYNMRFVEPKLLGRDLQFAIDLGLSETESSYSEYDTKSVIFRPVITSYSIHYTKLYENPAHCLQGRVTSLTVR